MPRTFPTLIQSLLALLVASAASGAIADAVLAVSEQPRPVLSKAEKKAAAWQRVQVCFRCHDMSEAAISQQPKRRQKKHRKAMKTQRPCLDCHNSTDVSCCHDHLFPQVDPRG